MRNNWQVFFLFILISALFAAPLLAQQQNLPLGKDVLLPTEKNIAKIDSAHFHSDFKPFIESPTKEYLPDAKAPSTPRSLLARKLLYENLLIIRDSADEFLLTIDPLLNFEYGKDLEDIFPTTSFYKNTRGVLVSGNIGKKFSFQSSFTEAQARFCSYIDQQIKTTNTLFQNKVAYPYFVVPGQGRAKSFKKSSYDFAMASGYVSFSPNKHFNFQAGTGKHFVGEGYRSLLLSDNAFNYPYLRITTSFGKIQYSNLYSVFMNLTDGGVTTPPGIERLFQKKAGSFQFLSWNINKRIQIGLFQGLIAEATDSSNKMKLHLPYANPLILSNALVYGLNADNNILLGSNINIKITNSILLYGQYMLDGVGSGIKKKNGFQAGAKYFDVLKIKGLYLQAEYNQVSPYSYSHNKAAQSYTHFNQALAHPLGSNFKEFVGILNYTKGRFFVKGKVNYVLANKNISGLNTGNNIFESDLTAALFSKGMSTTIKIVESSIGYIINPSYNLNVYAGVLKRLYSTNTMILNTTYFYIGIATSLNNFYYDF